MRTTRIFQDTPLLIGDIASLDSRASHHLQNVLRLHSDEQIVLFNGNGTEYKATLEINKKNVLAHITDSESTQRESPLQLTLVQGISRGDHMDWAIQKAVELGVTKIIPLFCERSMKIPVEKRLLKKSQHWQGIIIHACEQSGRCKLPTLAPPQTLSTYLNERNGNALAIILDPAADNSLIDMLTPTPAIEIFIGPEGGLSNSEIDIAGNAGFTPVSLGPRILRTETAGVAALSIVQATLGDLK